MRNGHCAIACNPSSTAETSSVVSAYTRRRTGSPKRERRVRKPPMKPFVPTTPTFVPSTRIPSRSDGAPYPASASTAVIASHLFACQSWFPRTATTGIVSGRHASATTAACSGLKVVRSPASRRRSARPSSVAKAPRTRRGGLRRRERRPRRRSESSSLPFHESGAEGTGTRE